MTVRSICIKGVHPAASERVLIAHFGACGYIQHISFLRWVGPACLHLPGWLMPVICMLPTSDLSSESEKTSGQELPAACPLCHQSPLDPAAPLRYGLLALACRDPASGRRTGVVYMQYSSAAEAQAALALDGG